MSEEQLKAFLEKVQTDTNLQEKLKAAHVDAALAIAKEAGFSIAADDLKKAQSELSKEELEGMAGGCPTYQPGHGSCPMSGNPCCYFDETGRSLYHTLMFC